MLRKRNENKDLLNDKIPSHVAVIMDGNGRWARSKMLPRVEGHRMGAKAVRKLVEESRRCGVSYLTLYCFSTENWSRPKSEISALMKLFEQYLASEQKLLIDNDIRLRIIGDRSLLSDSVNRAIDHAEAVTSGCTKMTLVLAVSYGGRQEILHAAQSMVGRAIRESWNVEKLEEMISIDEFRKGLYASDLPDVDLLIRTSGESRISNFLLWQSAYAEIVVSDVNWPAFDEREFHRCLSEYAGRTRRFGMTDEQLAAVEQG